MLLGCSEIKSGAKHTTEHNVCDIYQFIVAIVSSSKWRTLPAIGKKTNVTLTYTAC